MFKAGDKVVCVDGENVFNDSIISGAIYTAKVVREDAVRLEEVYAVGFWRSERFVLCSSLILELL
jgi:hypothetical protein